MNRPSLTDFDMAQIRLAANGMISGTLREWPALKHALLKCAINLHDSATRQEIVPICQDVLHDLERVE